jgi:hypothetical protein
MPKKKISLGDEIEDVVSKVRGIAHGHVEYLDGSEYWVIQPAALEGAELAKEVHASASYCRRVGDGVYPKPRQPMGFQAPEVES